MLYCGSIAYIGEICLLDHLLSSWVERLAADVMYNLFFHLVDLLFVATEESEKLHIVVENHVFELISLVVVYLLLWV